MGNALSTPIVLGAISLIPYNRYILWALGFVSLVLYAADRQRPSNKLVPLQASIDSVGETLKVAKASCSRNYPELVYIAHDFLELELSVSEIKYRLLETQDVSTWNEFKMYLESSKDMWQRISRYEKELKEIQSSILRIIEAQRQRGLSGDIQTSHEIISSLRSSTSLQC